MIPVYPRKFKQYASDFEQLLEAGHYHHIFSFLRLTLDSFLPTPEVADPSPSCLRKLKIW